jgi:tetratricopeptide (TPR) repeat protein
MEKHSSKYQTVSAELESLVVNRRFEEALPHCREIFVRIAGEGGRISAFAASAGALFFNAGALDATIQLLSEAIKHFTDDSPDSDELQVYLILGIALCTRNRGTDLLQAVRILNGGLDRVAGRDEHINETIELHGHLGNVMSMLGAHARGELQHQAAIALAQETKRRRAEELWTGNLGMNRLGADDVPRAIEHFVAALKLADEIGSQTDRARWELGLQSARARDKRDALASHVATLTAQIAEWESCLTAENDRRERERVAGEIEGIKERLRDFYLAFVHAIAGMRDAGVSARAIVPEAPELSNLLIGVATEVANTVHTLLVDLDRRIEPLQAGQAAPQPQSRNGSPELLQNGGRVLRLPEWLPHRRSNGEDAPEAVDDKDRAMTAVLNESALRL